MAEHKYITVNDDNFASEVLEADRAVLVDFWADWCGPCRALAPAVEELAREFEGRATVAKLDVDASPELAKRYQVRSIPSLVFFRDGAEADRAVGVRPKEELAAKLEDLVT